jgi:arginase
MDLGASRRGVDMGPSAIRVTGVLQQITELGWDAVDMGNIDTPIPEECEPGDVKKKYAKYIKDACNTLCQYVKMALSESRMPIVLGGDHSIAMGSVSGVAKFYKKQGKIGLLWIDAHGDMNTPQSTPSGNVHGMPFAHLLGMGDPILAGIGGFKGKILSKNAVLIGVRDLDKGERENILQSGIKVFTMKEVDRFGIPKVMEEAIKIASDGTCGIHVSFDIDVVDPLVAPGVGTPKKGGFNYREAHLCMELIADSGYLRSMDLVEVNPILDINNITAELAAELILSALGKRIF